MSAADRSLRQSAADRAGRTERVEAVARDLLADVECFSEDGLARSSDDPVVSE